MRVLARRFVLLFTMLAFGAGLPLALAVPPALAAGPCPHQHHDEMAVTPRISIMHRHNSNIAMMPPAVFAAASAPVSLFPIWFAVPPLPSPSPRQRLSMLKPLSLFPAAPCGPIPRRPEPTL